MSEEMRPVNGAGAAGAGWATAGAQRGCGQATEYRGNTSDVIAFTAAVSGPEPVRLPGHQRACLLPAGALGRRRAGDGQGCAGPEAGPNLSIVGIVPAWGC